MHGRPSDVWWKRVVTLATLLAGGAQPPSKAPKASSRRGGLTGRAPPKPCLLLSFCQLLEEIPAKRPVGLQKRWNHVNVVFPRVLPGEDSIPKFLTSSQEANGACHAVVYEGHCRSEDAK